MEQKYYLIFGIIVIGTILISSCIKEKTDTGDTGGVPVKDAVPVYETNQNIDSDTKAQQVFNENFEEILNNVKIKLEEDEYFIRHYSGLKRSCIENNEILSNKIKFERRAYQKDGKRFGSFWYGGFDKEQYTFKVYVIDQGEEWKEENREVYTSTTTCKDLAEAGTTNVETGELYCASGITQSWKLSYNLKYILDSEGTVYLAGEYCPT